MGSFHFGIRECYSDAVDHDSGRYSSDSEEEDDASDMLHTLTNVVHQPNPVIRGAHEHFHALLERINGEFMVLGFLAFCVWSASQADAFTSFYDLVGTGPHGLDLLHIFEVPNPHPSPQHFIQLGVWLSPHSLRSSPPGDPHRVIHNG